MIVIEDQQRTEQIGATFSAFGVGAVAKRTGCHELLVAAFHGSFFVGWVDSPPSAPTTPWSRSGSLRRWRRSARLSGGRSLRARRLSGSYCDCQHPYSRRYGDAGAECPDTFPLISHLFFLSATRRLFRLPQYGKHFEQQLQRPSYMKA